MTTKETIEEHREEFLACKTAQELKAIFERLGVATKQRWNKAVQAVIDLGGIDYYASRGEQRAASVETLRSQITHKVTLFVDAKARKQRFGICNADGCPVWYGIFFDDDKSFSYGDRNEQSACECAAARKAIRLASRVKEAVGATAIRLRLKVDANWLCTLAGKASILAIDARRFNIDLDMEWIPGTINPADKWTVASGFKRWDDNDLSALAIPVESSELVPA